MNKELSGAATDVLRALFFRGATVDGDLPSKSGVSELRELGYVKTQNFNRFDGENYYSFLTPSGQEFAISYLVDSHFGKKNDFRIRAGEVFAANTFLKDTFHFTTCSDKRLMKTLTGPGWRITNVSPKVSLSDDMRDAVIAAVRDSGQFVEKPTGDKQQSVVFMADRFKVTDGASASGEPTTQEKIQQGLAYEIEAAKASLGRHEAMMAVLASAQTAITKSINQAVNDAIANALKPGGLLYARK